MTERMPPAPREQRMQRLRVGLTGLAAVIVIVLLATAVASGVARRAPLGSDRVLASDNASHAAANAAEARTEPLAQLGVAPGAGAKNVDQTEGKAQR